MKLGSWGARGLSHQVIPNSLPSLCSHGSAFVARHFLRLLAPHSTVRGTDLNKDTQGPQEGPGSPDPPRFLGGEGRVAAPTPDSRAAQASRFGRCPAQPIGARTHAHTQAHSPAVLHNSRTPHHALVRLCTHARTHAHTHAHSHSLTKAFAQTHSHSFSAFRPCARAPRG